MQLRNAIVQTHPGRAVGGGFTVSRPLHRVSNRLSSEGLSFSSSLFSDRISEMPLASAGESRNAVRVSRPTKSNVPAAALRWSIERAGIEFGLTSQTLRKSLAKTSATPDADGLFTTKQIIAAVYGAFDQEKLATQKELTRKYQIANAIAEASVLDRSELVRGLATIADAMVARIMAADVSRSVKEDLLTDLAGVPLVLENVAHAQTKLPRGNRSRPED
jgi:hypothetical protein